MPSWFAEGFSIVGLIAVILQQIPGIVRMVQPPKLDPFARNSGNLLVETLEKTFGIATVILMVVVFARATLLPSLSQVFLIGSFVILAAYYALYVMYYLGNIGLPTLLGMAAFPPMCFLCIALYQGNYMALITSIIFGLVHIGLTVRNYATGSLGA